MSAPNRPTPLPGAWLLAIAGVVFDDAVLEQVVHPTIADLQREWIDAGTNRRQRARARLLGAIAFWSLVLMAPVAFNRSTWSPRISAGSPIHQRRFDMLAASKTRIALALVVLGAAAGYALSHTRPLMYRSSAVLQFMPATVPAGIADAVPASAGAAEHQMISVMETVVSPARLTTIAQEFGVFADTGSAGPASDAAVRMRRHVDVSMGWGSRNQIVVSFSHPDPAIAMRVTERLASSVVQETLAERERVADASLQFLDARLAETRMNLEALARRTSSLPNQLELDVLQSTYRSLLASREHAQAARDLDRRKIGERFVVLNAAPLPNRPVGPTRVELAFVGGTSGLAVALAIMLGGAIRRLVRSRRDLAAGPARGSA